MHRRICSIGNSQGVSIPIEILKKLNLSKDSKVNISIDEMNNRIIVEPVTGKKYPKGINREFVSQVNGFIEKYGPALKEVSGK